MEFSILVGTCDKYEFLWKKFYFLFEKYWDKTIDVKKYIVSETIDPNFPNFETILPGKIPYNETIRFALQKIETPYILWLQDDYFFQNTIPKQKFEQYLDFIKSEKVDRFCFKHRKLVKHYSLEKYDYSYYRMMQNSQYTISMQSSIWSKQFFLSCLSDHPETPWQFEILGTQRLNEKNHKIVYDLIDFHWYREASRKGNFTSEYYDIIEKENIKNL